LEEHPGELHLVERSKQGDITAFNSLVETYQQNVYNLCLRMLGSPQAAEDSTQDAFIAAFKAIGSFRGVAFRAWLFRIATNSCYDEMRRRRSRQATSLDEPRGDEHATLDVASEQATPQERAERRELAQLIQGGLSSIHPDQRIALVLCDVQGFDYAEIAKILEVSLGTVKSRIFRGRMQMRTWLRQHGGELLDSRYRQKE
jgi:RNA polymerase sigma-70 factor (ECF subfamily)